MTENTPTPTVEDYLMVIYVMQRDGKEIIAARLAEWMNVSPPTVSVTIKRMMRDGWLEMEGQHVLLTAQGRNAAANVLRRHMLSEHLLGRVLGVPWSAVHHEAGRLEHTLSGMTTERMAAVFNDPATCPHGNPLPGNEDILRDLIPLAGVVPGAVCAVVRIDEEAEENSQLLGYLEQQGVLPGANVIVQEVMPFNHTITVLCREHTVVLGLAAAEHVHVRVL